MEDPQFPDRPIVVLTFDQVRDATLVFARQGLYSFTALVAIENFQWGKLGFNKSDNPSEPNVPPAAPSSSPPTQSGTAGNDYLYATGDADVIDAGAGNDRIDAREGHDQIAPGDGYDTVDGGSGSDTVTYSASIAAIDIDLQLYFSQKGGFADRDVLASIENLVGTNFNDALRGSADNNYLSGGAGIDILDGRSGSDILDGGAGADTMIGGLGVDTASYGTATSSVYVHMLDLAQNTGDAAGDSYVSVENLTGSEFNDVLIATDEGNLVHGLGGDDVIVGLAGTNTLNGDDGNDAVHGGDDADIITGGAGNDNLFGYGGADNLQGGDGNDYFVGGDGNDTLIGGNGVDEIHASAGDDVLTGGSGDDGLFGDEGNDRIDGGSGNDYLNDSLGNDTFVFKSGYGLDFIAGFTAGPSSGDLIELTGLGVTSLTQIQALMTESGGNTFISFSDGSLLTLESVAKTQFTTGDFVFL